VKLLSQLTCLKSFGIVFKLLEINSHLLLRSMKLEVMDGYSRVNIEWAALIVISFYVMLLVSYGSL